MPISKNYLKFDTVVDLNICLKKSELLILLNTYASVSDLPSEINNFNIGFQKRGQRVTQAILVLCHTENDNDVHCDLILLLHELLTPLMQKKCLHTSWKAELRIRIKIVRIKIQSVITIARLCMWVLRCDPTR